MINIHIQVPKIKKYALPAGLTYIFLGGILSKLVAFLSNIVVVRLLDKPSYAALSYADNIYYYITLFSGLGMSSAVLKYCVKENDCINRAYYKFAFIWGSIVQFCVIAGVIFSICNKTLPFTEAKTLIYLLMPYGLLYYWYGLFQAFLRTRFKNKQYALSSFIQILFVFIFCIVGVSVFGLNGIAYARALALICSIFPFTNTIISFFKNKGIYKLSLKSDIFPFLILSFSFLISNVFSMIIPANETFLVNNLIRDEIISANYKVANLIPSQLPFVTNTIMIYYFPIFSKREKDPQLWQLIKKVGKYTALINILIVMVGIGITPLIIRIAYGDSYIDTAYMSNLLWGVYLINAGFRMIPMNILPALGYIKFNVIISIFSSLIHLCIDYLMIKHYGINGAVITTAITYLVTGLLYWIYVYRKCKEKLKYA